MTFPAALALMPMRPSRWDYGSALFLVGLLATLAGQLMTHWLMRALRRQSVIIFAMACLMVIACVTMYYESFILLRHAMQEKSFLEHGRICH